MRNARAMERGNALFIILLGIILLAALTYAVSGNFRGNSSLSQTKVEALSNDIILSAASVEKAVNKLIDQGTSESRISFTRTGSDGYQLTPTQTDAERVFSSIGGGAQWLDPPAEVLDKTRSAEAAYGSWFYTGYNRADGIGTTSMDLVAVLPFVRQDICVYLNNKLGITNPSGIPPRDVATAAFTNIKYIGTFDDPSGRSIDVTGSYTKGFKAGCVEGNLQNTSDDITGRYYFYYVLLAR